MFSKFVLKLQVGSFVRGVSLSLSLSMRVNVYVWLCVHVCAYIYIACSLQASIERDDNKVQHSLPGLPPSRKDIFCFVLLQQYTHNIINNDLYIKNYKRNTQKALGLPSWFHICTAMHIYVYIYRIACSFLLFLLYVWVCVCLYVCMHVYVDHKTNEAKVHKHQHRSVCADCRLSFIDNPYYAQHLLQPGALSLLPRSTITLS